MNKSTILLISALHMFFVHSTYSQSVEYIKKNRIHFIPEEFNKVNEKEWFSGEVFKDGFNSLGSYPYVKDLSEHQQLVDEAQAYSDDELDMDIDASKVYGGNLNLNLFSYIRISEFTYTEGTYELYITQFGLKSNHIYFDIEFRNEEDDHENEYEKYFNRDIFKHYRNANYY